MVSDWSTTIAVIASCSFILGTVIRILSPLMDSINPRSRIKQ